MRLRAPFPLFIFCIIVFIFGSLSISGATEELAIHEAEIVETEVKEEQSSLPEEAKKEEPEEEEPEEEEPFYEEEEAIKIADPFYFWNKGMYYFNDRFYFWVMKPVAKTYKSVVPEDIRLGFSNFFYNLTTPIRFVNDILQLKMKYAGNELLRFIINSTFGVVGFVDVAKKDFKFERHDEDLGQTFGTYGIGHGFYIVWPILGPMSLRDTVGFVGDRFLDPIMYTESVGISYEATAGIVAFDEVNETSFRIGDYEALKEAAIDPYLMIRDAYLQNRKKKIEE
ncbi:MAG: VacJ family lipoprotein [Nitrospirota bacterium]